MTHRVVDHFAATRRAGKADDQGHPDGGVVDEVAVELLAVVAEALAVVRGQNHQRSIKICTLFQGFAEVADQGVGVGDLALVGAPAILRRKRLRRRVGIVRVVEVEPQKERRGLVALVEPAHGFGDGLIARTLHRTEVRILEFTEIEVVEVAVETAPDPPPRVEHEGAHETAGLSPGGLQRLRDGRRLVAEEVADVLPHAVPRRIGAGHDRGVGGQGERDRARGVGESHALAPPGGPCSASSTGESP